MSVRAGVRLLGATEVLLADGALDETLGPFAPRVRREDHRGRVAKVMWCAEIAAECCLEPLRRGIVVKLYRLSSSSVDRALCGVYLNRRARRVRKSIERLSSGV